jgi:hypothetical protein
MSADLTSFLAGVDITKLRSSSSEMRAALNAAAAAGGRVWTGLLEDVVAALSEVGRVDLCLARLVEGHADALRILDEAGATPGEGIYGVWASRSVGTGLRARPSAAGWTLEGELRFASGIGLIDRCLVSASLDAEHHLLFDVGLDAHADGIDADESSWATPAMDASRSIAVRVATQVQRADQVGGRDFYLSRPGFAVGGLGVAAVWAGGARQVADAVADGLRRFTPTPHQHRRLGLMAQAAWTADLAVSSTARALPSLPAGTVAREVARARTAVVLGCDIALEQAPLVVGPGGLSTNTRLVRALADLAIYVRQHHLDAETSKSGEDFLASTELLGS